MNAGELADTMRTLLLESVMPFWLHHSPDNVHGGYYTCLERDGTVYDTEKYTWLQARQLWMFSHLWQTVEQRDNWLAMADLGADFLTSHGRDQYGQWYYALHSDGRPFMQPFSIFSEGFAAMGFSAYAIARQDDKARHIAELSLMQFMERYDKPKGRFNKAVSGGDSLLPLSLRMILMNMLLEMEWMIPDDQFEKLGRSCVREVMSLFLDNTLGVLYENVTPDGSHPDIPAGRLINPGHGLEVLWMTMSLAERLGMRRVISRCVEASLQTIQLGWDTRFGGILYRHDARAKPLYEITWDQKMWWVHAEALITLAMGWRLTKEPACLDWLNRVWTYVVEHYLDPEFGEWFGYCNRRGERLLECKGNRWKGCFHVPRALLMVWRELLEE